MRKIALLVVAAITLTLSACAGQPVSADVAMSDKPRDTSPAVDKADMEALVRGNNAFAFNLYHRLAPGNENLFFSPYSISEALAMTYAGARGDTEKAMAKALNFTLPQERLHPAFNSLDLQLKQRGQGAKGKDGKGFRVNVVNALWGQKGFNFLSAFLDTLAQNYGAGLRLVDFINQTEQARLTINNWVSEQTEGRINDLIPPGALNQMTRLVLTNAIYFNAAWQYPFDKNATADAPFRLLDGRDVTVPMMRQTRSFNYTEGTEYQAVELPYDGRELSMVILLPRSGQFRAFEKRLDAEVVQSIIGQMAHREVALTMPKFTYESSFSLRGALTDLGMGVAFDPTAADFSGMDGRRDLFIQDALHKAFVAVDEAGTEAAAATAVIIGLTSVPQPPVEMKVDRPFIFLIRDIPTGSIIFVGRVLNPATK